MTLVVPKIVLIKKKIPFNIFGSTSFILGGKLQNDTKNMCRDVVNFMLFSILAPAWSLWSLKNLLLYYHHWRTKGEYLVQYVKLKFGYKIETCIKQFLHTKQTLDAKKCLKFCSSLLIPCSCCGHLCQKFKLADRKKCQEFEPKITQPFITFKTMFAIIFQIS